MTNWLIISLVFIIWSILVSLLVSLIFKINELLDKLEASSSDNRVRKLSGKDFKGYDNWN